MTPEEQVRLSHGIRDTSGLTANEKAFCRLIVDRGGILYATWRQNAADMGVGKDAYYRARNGALAKGVVSEHRRFKASTNYTLMVERLGGDVSTSRHSGGPEPKTGYISTTSRHPDADRAPTYLFQETTESASPGKKPCGCFVFQMCLQCSPHSKVESRLPEFKQRELMVRDLAENEGLNEYGEPLGLDY